MDYERWAHALAMTESNGKSKAWGDNGLACGRWQMHPAFVWDYGPDAVGVRWSWDSLFAATLRNFFEDRSPKEPSPVRLAMEFHLGVQAVKDGQFDDEYADRFVRFYATAGGQS